jgi:hypothetical protein
MIFVSLNHRTQGMALTLPLSFIFGVLDTRSRLELDLAIFT